MGVIIKKKEQLVKRLILGIVLLKLFSISPLIIGIIGATISEKLTGETCHEGNCSWGVLPWLTFFTFPIGVLLGIIFLVIVFRDYKKLKYNDSPQ